MFLQFHVLNIGWGSQVSRESFTATFQKQYYFLEISQVTLNITVYNKQTKYALGV